MWPETRTGVWACSRLPLLFWTESSFSHTPFKRHEDESVLSHVSKLTFLGY